MPSWFESRLAVRSVFAGRRLLHRLLSNESYMEGLTIDLHSSESVIPLPAVRNSDLLEPQPSSKNKYVGALTIENWETGRWTTVEVLAGAEVLSKERLFVQSRAENLISINIDEDSEGGEDITLRVRTE